MSSRAFVGAAVLACAFSWSTISHATTFSGTLNGIISSGQAGDFDAVTFEGHHFDLKGATITIDFTVQIEKNYTDPIYGDFYPRYVVNSVRVRIPALDTVPALADVGSTQSNNINAFGFADFSGNAHVGSFYLNGLIDNEPDFQQYVAFSFANASPTFGLLTGSGSASRSFYDGRYYEADYSLAFDLISGSVTATGVPEPRSWALMIAGVGLVGAGMRRRSRTAVPA